VLGAYVLWGFLPLYWPYLRPAGLLEILAHRVVWSLVAAVAAVLLLRRRHQFLLLFTTRRTRVLLTVSGTALLVNWLVFLGAADRGEGVDISLGYFISPLITVAVGRVVLREQVRPWQWAALGGVSTGVAVLTIDAGMFPLTGFALALSWAVYGLAKKVARVGAVESLAVETLLIAPWGALYLTALSARGHAQFTTAGPLHALLLIGAGVVTIVPLMLFSAGAPHLPMVTLGPLQYVGPAIQFLLGVLVLHNQMSPGRWIGFAVIGASLALFAAESTRATTRPRVPHAPSLTLHRGAVRENDTTPRPTDHTLTGLTLTGLTLTGLTLNGADTRLLREVLGHAATCVTVVSTLDGQDPVGCTVGSFVSVSLDPPLVGWFAMQSSATLAAITRSGTFSVNVLAEDQSDLAQRFAHRTGDRFHGLRWEPGIAGSPHLHGALAVIDCALHRVLTVGDHELVLGRVTGATVDHSDAGPLLFAGGRYRALARTTSPRVPGLADTAPARRQAG
jgi:chloramphenicol-sensitive protein RarD